MQIVRSLDKTTWRRFVDEHPKGNIFHTPEMFDVFSRAKGILPALWSVVDEGKQPLALLLPLQITLIGGLLRDFTSRAVAHGSVLNVPGDEGQKALRLLLHSYRENVKGSVLFTELRNLSAMDSVQQVLLEHGFKFEEHLNYLIDLDRSPDALLQSFSRRTRKRIRRAIRQGKVTVEEIKQQDQVKLCYNLIHKSYMAAKVPLADLSMFEAAYEILYPRGIVKFLVSWAGDEAVAASAELLYKDTIYGWYGGVDRDFSEFVPNELLMWHILKWGADNGYRLYDFGGAGKPDEEYGVRDFKAKFGGELVCYGRNTLVHAPIKLSLSKAGYKSYRHTIGVIQSILRN